MPTNVVSRSHAKGIEFSDHLIVLGAPPRPSTPASHATPLPKAHVFVHRGQVATREMASDIHADHPDTPRNISAYFEHTVVDDDETIPFDISSTIPKRTPGKRRARFFEHAPELISDDMVTPSRAYDEPVETSCTDSEEDPVPYTHQPTQSNTPQLQQSIERCTRINTKLNSLPSGGAFSLMNSSEDVDLSSSDDERRTSSRKLVRVHGSAKLSTASGLGEDSFDVDDDEFAIEGAERVGEEEAVNVRSFGRSFARVCLKDDMDDAEAEKLTKWEKDKSQVAFTVPDQEIATEKKANRVEDGVASDSASAVSSPSGHKKALQHVFAESRSAPPRRKSRLRLTFIRRMSMADREEANVDGSANVSGSANVLDDSVSGVTRLSCFPMRKSPTKQRSKSGDISGPRVLWARTLRDDPTGNRTGMTDGTNQVVAVPEFDLQNRKSSRTRKSRKIVKNVSMQRDDWIDFATNSPHRQRSQWFARIISAGGGDSEVSSRRDSRGTESDMTRQSKGSGWRLWRLWSRR